MAAECILAGELGIPYAAVCVVDNLANGVAPTPLSVAEFEAGKEANRARLLAALDAVVAGARRRSREPRGRQGAVLDGRPVGLRTEDGGRSPSSVPDVRGRSRATR